MGWCYEFGAQIHDGCGAPMVAAAASCTCSQCGTVCPGRFASCREVWARGPQQFTVVSPPAVPGQVATNALSPVAVHTNGSALEGTSDTGPVEMAVMVGETSEAVAAGRLAVRVENRMAQLETRLGALEALAAYVQALRGTLKTDLSRLTAEVSGGGGALARQEERITTLEARVTDFDTLPARLDALSREVFELRRRASAEPASLGSAQVEPAPVEPAPPPSPPLPFSPEIAVSPGSAMSPDPKVSPDLAVSPPEPVQAPPATRREPAPNDPPTIAPWSASAWNDPRPSKGSGS